MFSFRGLKTIAKRVLPPSEIEWLAASVPGDKQCYTTGSCSPIFVPSCHHLTFCCGRGEWEWRKITIVRNDGLLRIKMGRVSFQMLKQKNFVTAQAHRQQILFSLDFFFRGSPKVFKTRLLGRGFHTFIKNVSFYSPTNVGSHNPSPFRA